MIIRLYVLAKVQVYCVESMSKTLNQHCYSLSRYKSLQLRFRLKLFTFHGIYQISFNHFLLFWLQYTLSSLDHFEFTAKLYRRFPMGLSQSGPKVLDSPRHQQNKKLWTNVPNMEDIIHIWHIGSNQSRRWDFQTYLNFPDSYLKRSIDWVQLLL